MMSTSRSVGLVLGALLMAAPAAAQSRARAGGPAVAPSSPAQSLQVTQGDGRIEVVLPGEQNADQTRNRLQKLLDQYPNTLAEVLRRDPSLLHNDGYLAPYPALAIFLGQHPEVAHNPAFFLGSPGRDPYATRDPSIERARAVENVFSYLTVLIGLMSFFALVGWVSKAIIEQRRWSRVSKVQNEANAKIIDRLSSNEDLLAYIQTPAGQRYLESAPLSVGAAEGPASAPYSRILWSVQMGTVASVVGVAFLFVSARWGDATDWSADFSRMLFLVGSVVLACGVGFVLSGFASYALSRRFGLIQSPPAPHA